MVLKVLIVSTLLHYSVFGQHYNCSQRSALLLLRHPVYDFSVNLLERVAINNQAHFVFSPLTTWLQLNALAEGAEGRTLRELKNFTRHHKNRCFKDKLARIIRKLNIGLKEEYKRRSIMIIDELMAVKGRYMRDVQRYYGVKVMVKSFSYPVTSAAQANKFIQKGTNDVIHDAIYAEDFIDTVMLMSDNVVFRSAWKYPFDPSNTQIEPFKTKENAYIGYVNMMNLIGKFNMVEMPHINAKILEIPCVGDFSMLILMPIVESWVGDTFFYLKRTTLSAIYKNFRHEGEKTVAVRLPRFRINSTVDNLPELLYDMGIERIFGRNTAELDRISDYPLYASFMIQAADIEVTETGVRANVPANLTRNDTSDPLDFIADKPFAYMLIDRRSQFILFAGTYSTPTLY